MTRSRIGFKQQSTIEEPVINLTPLIDVVFVILIMFILIAPLLDLDLVELADGPSAALNNVHTVQESSLVAIHVHRDNSIWFNGRAVSVIQLTEELKIAKQRYPKVVPQIFHDKQAHFGIYQSVKNAAEEAGYSQMEIILKPA